MLPAVGAFDYDLPNESIAQEPLADRSGGRLLVAHAPGWAADHRLFRDLPKLIPSRSLIIRNETRVIPARVFLHRPSGANIEVFCLEERSSGNGVAEWSVLTRGKAPVGTLLTTTVYPGIQCEILERFDDATALARWSYPKEFRSFADVLQKIGHVPLPPYMTREDRPEDRIRYQTVFARTDGSVAAPTAGLHFDSVVLQAIEANGSAFAPVCLHVGLGTFQPMKSADLRTHAMHQEKWSVPLGTLQRLVTHLKDPARGWTVAVGTTSLRTLESLAWSALIGTPDLPQWTAVETPKPSTSQLIQALETLIQETQARGKIEVSGTTRLMIAPGAHVLLVEALITNFHQPMSTLLALVENFVGPAWRTLYAEALQNGYRFLSYGDACLFRRSS